MGKLSHLVGAIEGAVKQLDMSRAARMERAKAQGFDTDSPVYHGTSRDFDAFSVEGKGKTAGAGAFFTDSPNIAESYTSGSNGRILPSYIKKDGHIDIIPDFDMERGAPNWNDIETNGLLVEHPDGTQDLAVDIFDLEPNDFTTTDELSSMARQRGYKSATFRDVVDAGPNTHTYHAEEYLRGKGLGDKLKKFPDGSTNFIDIPTDDWAEAFKRATTRYRKPSDVTAVFDPSNIRSVNAAFDPAKAESSNLLASMGGAAVLGGAALAPEQAEASFLGQGAKFADKMMLEIAEKMKAHGISNDEIWRKTGWGEGVDGKWRFEVSDDAARTMPFTDRQNSKMADQGFNVGQTEDFIRHKELMEASPNLKDIDVFVDADLSGGGFTAGTEGTAELFGTDPSINVGWRGGGADKSTMLHELQHATQAREGFARGGNTSGFTDKNTTDLLDDIDLQLSDMLYKGGATDLVKAQQYNLAEDAYDRNNDLLKAKYPGEDSNGFPEWASSISDAENTHNRGLWQEWRDAAEAWGGSHEYELLKGQRHSTERGRKTQSAHDQYRSLAGEVEARNVQTRMDMGPTERRELPPWTTEDIPRSEQIIRMRGKADPALLAGVAGVGGAGVAAAPFLAEREAQAEPQFVDSRTGRRLRGSGSGNQEAARTSQDEILNTPMELMSSVNRGAADTVDFLASQVPNAFLELLGSKKRVNSMYDIPGLKEATEGNYMPEGQGRNNMRLLGEMLSPL